MNYVMNTGLQNAGTNLQSPLRFAVGQDAELRAALASDDPADIEKLNAFAREREVPFYSNVFKFYGPEEVIRAQWDYTRRRLSSIPNARFRDGAFYRFPLSDEEKFSARDPQDLGFPTLSTFSIGARSLVILCMFYVMPDVASNQAVRRTFRRLVEVAAEHGWGEYRTHTAFMDECAAAYSFNAHALLRLQETLKDAIDPNGILSAGRYGIWPKHLREA
jgi:4-cresol dehydrogenase (hydroxylating)